MMANSNQNTNLSRELRKLDQLGSPVDLLVAEEEAEEAKLEIVQAGPYYDANIFDLEDGRSGYVFHVDIVNRTSRPIYCTGVELHLRRPDPDFDWLSDPRERHRNVQYYSFPGKSAGEFPRGHVLNHVLLSEGILQPRVPYQGWLLAVGGPMPTHLSNGDQVEATLVIVAAEGTEYTEEIFLFAERRAIKPKVKNRGSSLYGAPAGREIEPAVGEPQRSDPGATSSVMPSGRSFSR